VAEFQWNLVIGFEGDGWNFVEALKSYIVFEVKVNSKEGSWIKSLSWDQTNSEPKPVYSIFLAWILSQNLTNASSISNLNHDSITNCKVSCQAYTLQVKTDRFSSYNSLVVSMFNIAKTVEAT
jgi:hypothetical protein